MSCALGVLRTISCFVKDAARVDTRHFRASDACYSYLIKYNLPVSKAGKVMASTPQFSAPLDPEGHSWTLKRPTSPAGYPATESRLPNRDRSTRVKRKTRESGRGHRRSRSRSRVKNSAHTDVRIDKEARATRTSVW